jgi:hypothetical protein
MWKRRRAIIRGKQRDVTRSEEPTPANGLGERTESATKAAGDRDGLADSHGCGRLLAQPTTDLPVDTLADHVVDA